MTIQLIILGVVLGALTSLALHGIVDWSAPVVKKIVTAIVVFCVSSASWYACRYNNIAIAWVAAPVMLAGGCYALYRYGNTKPILDFLKTDIGLNLGLAGIILIAAVAIWWLWPTDERFANPLIIAANERRTSIKESRASMESDLDLLSREMTQLASAFSLNAVSIASLREEGNAIVLMADELEIAYERVLVSKQAYGSELHGADEVFRRAATVWRERAREKKGRNEAAGIIEFADSCADFWEALGDRVSSAATNPLDFDQLVVGMEYVRSVRTLIKEFLADPGLPVAESLGEFDLFEEKLRRFVERFDEFKKAIDQLTDSIKNERAEAPAESDSVKDKRTANELEAINISDVASTGRSVQLVSTTLSQSRSEVASSKLSTPNTSLGAVSHRTGKIGAYDSTSHQTPPPIARRSEGFPPKKEAADKREFSFDGRQLRSAKTLQLRGPVQNARRARIPAPKRIAQAAPHAEHLVERQETVESDQATEYRFPIQSSSAQSVSIAFNESEMKPRSREIYSRPQHSRLVVQRRVDTGGRNQSASPRPATHAFPQVSNRMRSADRRTNLTGVWSGSFVVDWDGMTGENNGTTVDLELQLVQASNGQLRGSFIHDGFTHRDGRYSRWGANGSVSGTINGARVKLRFHPAYVPTGTTLSPATYEGAIRGGRVTGKQIGDHGGHGTFQIDKK